MLTIASGVTISGSNGTITSGTANLDIEATIDSSGTGTNGLTVIGNWNNDGLVESTSGEMTLSGTWTNNADGTIEAANGGSVELAGSFTDAGSITGVTGFIYLDGTLNNSGQTLNLRADTGSWYMRFGTVVGGTVSASGGAELVGSHDGGTLDGVTLAGTLDLTNPSLPNATITIRNGLTLDAGTVELTGGSTLNFEGSQDLSGTGTVSLNSESPGDGLLVPTSGDTLTIQSGVMVQGNSGAVGSSGTGLITNNGKIEAIGGGTLTVKGYTNFASGTLVGGTWGAIGGSTLRLVGANVTTNAASILLDGAGSQIDSAASGTTSALAEFVTNAANGSFTIQNGANFTSSQALTIAGTVTVDGGDTFAAGGTGIYTQTGGTTILNSGILGANGNQIDIQGGTLSGPGTVVGMLTNGGEIDLGSTPGRLTVDGTFTQTAAGTLTIKVAGASAGILFDQVTVTSTASLDGTLTATLLGGYAPGLEEAYPVLTFASSTGSFVTFNTPQINGEPAFATNTTPTSVDLIGATTGPNLAVSNVTFTPVSAVQGQNMTVSYTVTNLGTVATTAGSWTDSVYLSLDGMVDNNAVLVGRVAHTGNLGSQAGYSASLTAPVPGFAVGSYYVLVVADSGLQVPDINRANGTGVASTELSTQPPTLTLSTPATSFSGSIASGQDLYYRLNVVPGTSVELNAIYALADEAELYLKFGALPTANDFDQSDTNTSDQQPQLLLPSGQGGPYYIWLHGLPGAGAGEPFTLVPSLLTFAISSFSPSSSSPGPVTINVSGTDFTSQTTVSLKSDSGQVLNPSHATLISANELYATFDLSNAAAGNYSVVATDGRSSTAATSSFQVTAQGNSNLRFVLGINGLYQSFETNPPPPQTLQAPGDYYLPQTPPAAGESQSSGGGGDSVSGEAANFTVSLEVSNLGSTNVEMPAIEIDVTHAEPSFGILPAATLAPGGLEFSEFAYNLVPPTPGTSANVSFQELPPQTTLDWATQILAPVKPPDVPATAWTAIVDNFVNSVGTTEGSLDAALQADALDLAQVGDPVTDEESLLGFELLKAEDVLPSAVLSRAVDSNFAEPGLPLTFERSFVSSLQGRYTLGDLGYGWTSNWDISALTDSSGNVYIQEGPVTRGFTNNKDGSYTGIDGDQGVLTLSQGSYTLRDLDGTVTSFLPDGQLNFVQDANGNRITAGYNALGQMTSLTALDGDSMTFRYNAQGLISQVADPAGNVTTYSYDAYEQLVSVTDAQGTTQYTYINGQGIAEEHNLASITNVNGTRTSYGYDSRGRLVQQSQAGGGSLTYAYQSPGGYTVTDMTGATTTVLYDASGQSALVTDPLGNVTRITYNSQGQPLTTTYPGGIATSSQYNSQGKLVSQTDAQGNTTNYTTNSQVDADSSFQNPDGQSTSFGYTPEGNLASITQPDGTASEYFYNAQGQVIESIDAEAQATTYTYDSQGRLTDRKNPDGSTVTMTYDANNNLLSVSDTGDGKITMTYNVANLLTSISYPNGQWLDYAYNSVGQLTQLVEQGGLTENYTYNTIGQLTEMTDANGNLIVSYTYDLAGRWWANCTATERCRPTSTMLTATCCSSSIMLPICRSIRASCIPTTLSAWSRA